MCVVQCDSFRSPKTGRVTVGYDFNMETQYARDVFKSLDLNYDDIFFNRSCLTQKNADDILNATLQVSLFQTSIAIGEPYVPANVYRCSFAVVFSGFLELCLKVYLWMTMCAGLFHYAAASQTPWLTFRTTSQQQPFSRSKPCMVLWTTFAIGTGHKPLKH